MSNELVFKEIICGIYILRVPFENDFTSVFAINTPSGAVIVDSATTCDDVKAIILPALKSSGLAPVALLSSHFHSDHMGGEPFLSKAFPHAKRLKIKSQYDGNEKRAYLSDREVLFDCLEILHLPGHTEDSLAVLDNRSKTLITADCLQLYGVGAYGTGISDVKGYADSINKLRQAELENIIASHDYYPLGITALGKKAVKNYLDTCEKSIFELCDFVRDNSSLSCEELASLYSKVYPERPPVPTYTFAACMKA